MCVKNVFFLMMVIFLLSACHKKVDNQNFIATKKAEMIAAEIAFSSLSEAQGTRKAFMQYIDSNGVLLRPNSFPLVGADAVDFISQTNDTSYTMVWQPKGGTVAASGDLGYTFGVYTITQKNKGAPLYGNYVNIWKKQQDGSWKLLLDSGNEGVEATGN